MDDARGPEVVCPVSRRPLEAMPLREAESVLGRLRQLPAATYPVSPDSTILVERTSGWAYPVVDDIGILLSTERLLPASRADDSSLDGTWSDAYRDIDVYTRSLQGDHREELVSTMVRRLQRFLSAPPDKVATFPDPPTWWAGMQSDVAAVHDALRNLRPLKGTTVLQVGGTGSQAAKLLGAGAARAIAVSPVLAELQALQTALRRLNAADRVTLLVGVGEQLPLADGSVDRVVTIGSLHHMDTSKAFPEAHRVLADGGRFASADVHAAPLYPLGIRLFGKRERDVQCVPLDLDRLSAADAFDNVTLRWHGAVARYPLSLLERIGRPVSPERAWKLASWEDRLVCRWPSLARHASMVTVVATK